VKFHANQSCPPPKLARESTSGDTFVAVQEFRCVQFSKDVSGMMIVIVRYRVKLK